MIQEIRIANFKSFGDEIYFPLSPFSVFIGPNAAGKSNLMDAFRFLRECVAEGMETAVARRAGWSNLRCRRRRKGSTLLGVRGTLGVETLNIAVGRKKTQPFRNLRFTYDLMFHQELVVLEEKGALIGIPEGIEEEQEISAFERDTEYVTIREWSDSPRKLSVGEANQKELFVRTRFFSLASSIISDMFLGWRFYDPLTQSARFPTEIRTPHFVSETGDNLAAVLHVIRSNGGTRERIRDLLQMLVPGFEDWETEELADGRITFRVRESGVRGALPSIAISDGTVRLLILLSALLWSDIPPAAIFLEEPERNLHPLVLEPLVQLMREVSAQTQVIVTTHSADFVRHCLPEEVYLMDKVDGCTQIVRADSIEQIQEFLQHFTLDELWLQGYLERGRP
ncbi:MAG: AAA family ATPase [Thermoflexales bacterium]|nr:AAA family ATPase [Thermoflexales bacterium]